MFCLTEDWPDLVQAAEASRLVGEVWRGGLLSPGLCGCTRPTIFLRSANFISFHSLISIFCCCAEGVSSRCRSMNFSLT